MRDASGERKPMEGSGRRWEGILAETVKTGRSDFLVVQWLRLWAPNAGATGSIPG